LRLDLFVKLKYQSSTLILSVGINYSLRDLLFLPLTMPYPQRYAPYAVNDVSSPSGISSP